MELWIRSQDKEVLVKINDIAVEMNMIYGYFDKNTEYELLGSYKSKERALEVLDDISNKIKNQFIVQVNGLLKPSDQRKIKSRLEKDYVGDFIMSDGMLDIKPINQNLFLYEMPQE